MKSSNERTKKTAWNEVSAARILAMLGYVLIIIVYIAGDYYAEKLAPSKQLITIWDHTLPLSSFTGVVASVSNICMILLTVFYKKTGFFTSLAIFIVRFYLLFRGVFIFNNAPSVPGIFTSAVTLIVVILIFQKNQKVEKYQKLEVKHLKDQRKLSQRLFEQTAIALVNIVDAKDVYSHGHSLRVAEYSRKIAEMMGKSEEECYQIYYIALLHDVGKIGIPDEIIKKKGKLTSEEYEIIKEHPVIGNQILSSISEYPYLSIGAHYHHERYDGKGYPEHLKGEDIPEIARIIAVADAYDAMTSKRSYRDTVPQQIVREEIVKNSGTQFDPEIAKVMQHLIDIDSEYQMKERATVPEFAGRNELHCEEFRSEYSKGILIDSNITKIHVRCIPEELTTEAGRVPALIIFDAMDGRVHTGERTIREMDYFEYCEVWLDGHTVNKGVRSIVTNRIELSNPKPVDSQYSAGQVYDIEAVKYKDHMLLKMESGKTRVDVTIAFPDCSRYAYISLTGEYCILTDVSIDQTDQQVSETYIPRIVDEISYINEPAGDIPNVQIDSFRTAASEGIPITDGMKLTFHAMSLPTARLIWHCPYIDLFYADDKKVEGTNYREYALIRFDGEYWESAGIAVNKLILNLNEDFEGWEVWKKMNKKGVDCVATFRREDNKIITTIEHLGLSIRNITTILDGTEELYVALTGDQCALTNIRIER